jgi:hypothetical protein
MLNHRRTALGGCGDSRIEWWGVYHATWVQVTVSSSYDHEWRRMEWYWTIVRSLGEGRRAFVAAGDELPDEASAIRAAFDALRRKVRS